MVVAYHVLNLRHYPHFDELIEPFSPHTVGIHAVSMTIIPLDSMRNISFRVKRNIRRIHF
jgi:hypothetical protein